MANTSSAKKSARKIAARTEINKSRTSRMRTFIRKVEEAIAGGNHDTAVAALKAAEPEIARSAQRASSTPTSRRAKSRVSTAA